MSYQYDARGRRATMTVSGQAPVSYTYDANSRLRTITQAPLNPVDIQYDALGRRTLLTLPNAVSTEYQYDAASRLTALIYHNALGPLGDLTYTYDAGGNRIGVGGSFARTLLPDAVTTSSYDAANRQLTFGGKTMTFDDNNSLVTLTEGGSTTIFTWDARNRLRGMGGLSVSASFTYDAFGRRAMTTVNGMVRTLQFDGRDVVQEVSGGQNRFFLSGLRLDEIFAQITGGADTKVFLADGLGGTLALTGMAGIPDTAYTYGPFGQAVIGGPPDANPFQFTGRENDGSGLYFYRARYYHPKLSRFVSEDPIGLAGGINAYAYVGNSPITYVDPLGLNRIPYPEIAKAVAANNRSGLSDELVLCIAWKESSHNPDAKHGSTTEIGLMGMSRGASEAVGYDWARDVGDNNEANIAAGSAYLRNRVELSGRRHPGWTSAQNIRRGIELYGTGSSYPVDKILDCEDCLKRLPPDVAAGKCPPQPGADPQECLDKINRK